MADLFTARFDWLLRNYAFYGCPRRWIRFDFATAGICMSGGLGEDGRACPVSADERETVGARFLQSNVLLLISIVHISLLEFSEGTMRLRSTLPNPSICTDPNGTSLVFVVNVTPMELLQNLGDLLRLQRTH